MENSRTRRYAATCQTPGARIGLALIGLVWFALGGTLVAAEEAQVLRYEVRTGALIDLGWTGTSHAQPWPADQILAFRLTCPDTGDDCTLGGGAAGDAFGAPIPLSSGGAPACVVNRLRDAINGTMQRKKGCAEIKLGLTSRVFMAHDLARPCPVCEDDPTANDGQRQGTCAGGAHAGRPCDAHATSTRFGATSNDCLPAGTGVGDLSLDLVLRTGAVALESGPPCANVPPGGICLCDAQATKNACFTGECPPTDRCDQGPYDGTCDGQPYRPCTLGSSTEDCEARFPGAGTCQSTPRPCFGAPLATSGTCDPTTPTFVATFCVAATRAASLNATAGLPGPARLVLPLQRLE